MSTIRRYSWTQAICHACWNERNPDRPSSGVNPGYEETCAYCGEPTTSGIYVRDDPETVPYPQPKD